MLSDMRILVVEDEIHLCDAVTHLLKRHNYTVDAVNDGVSGLDNALSGIYDLILLDIMLPGMDGITVLRNIREQGIATPVILLTAKGEISDKVQGLDCGADDYLSKPFAAEELMARIRSASRRKGEFMPDGIHRFGDIELNASLLKLTRGDRTVKLTLKESEMIELFILRKNMITSKEMIIEKLWGYDSEAEYNNVEVYVSFLRKKLLFLESSVIINTIRGAGYLLEVRSACSGN